MKLRICSAAICYSTQFPREPNVTLKALVCPNTNFHTAGRTGTSCSRWCSTLWVVSVLWTPEALDDLTVVLPLPFTQCLTVDQLQNHANKVDLMNSLDVLVDKDRVSVGICHDKTSWACCAFIRFDLELDALRLELSL